MAWPNGDQYGVVELFAGTASVATGFQRATGLAPLYLVDNEPLARDCARENLGQDVPYVVNHVEDVSAADVLEAADGRKVAGILGCPPCQGWSAAGSRKDDDGRNQLLGELFRLADDLQPLFIAMENVPAVARRDELAHALAPLRANYNVWTGVLNAAAYGLPQTRQRAIVLAYSKDLGIQPSPPMPTHGGKCAVWDYREQTLVTPSASTIDSLLGCAPEPGDPRGTANSMARLYHDVSALKDLVTVEDAIGDLDGESPSSYADMLTAPDGSTPNHEPWGHGRDLVRRLSLVQEGCLPPLEATNNRRYYSQAYARLHRRGLARTITTNFHNPGSGRFLHYRRDRTLTVREAARLQGFPDWFQFAGSKGHQARLVGNAFPLLWAEVLAGHITEQLVPALRDTHGRTAA